MVWNQAASTEAATAWLRTLLGVAPAAVAELSILHGEDEQRRRLSAARKQLGAPARRVMVVTKGWEPPLLEFMDFLALVREVLGAGASITVVPLELSGTAVAAPDRDVWARALARLRDPRLYVMEATA